MVRLRASTEFIIFNGESFNSRKLDATAGERQKTTQPSPPELGCCRWHFSVEVTAKHSSDWRWCFAWLVTPPIELKIHANDGSHKQKQPNDSIKQCSALSCSFINFLRKINSPSPGPKREESFSGEINWPEISWLGAHYSLIDYKCG